MLYTRNNIYNNNYIKSVIIVISYLVVDGINGVLMLLTTKLADNRQNN